MVETFCTLRVHSCASMLNICSESMSAARMSLYSIFRHLQSGKPENAATNNTLIRELWCFLATLQSVFFPLIDCPMLEIWAIALIIVGAIILLGLLILIIAKLILIILVR